KLEVRSGGRGKEGIRCNDHQKIVLEKKGKREREGLHPLQCSSEVRRKRGEDHALLCYVLQYLKVKVEGRGGGDHGL
ncbi:hypothetical protein SK128_018240, partial [Halocaridina rubra]